MCLITQEHRGHKTTYKISRKIQEKYPELVTLICTSPSMNEASETQYWLTALDNMFDTQIDNLFRVLTKEHDNIEIIKKKLCCSMVAWGYMPVMLKEVYWEVMEDLMSKAYIDALFEKFEAQRLAVKL